VQLGLKLKQLEQHLKELQVSNEQLEQQLKELQRVNEALQDKVCLADSEMPAYLAA
jgi:chaperonin cofactor prefoldin